MSGSTRHDCDKRVIRTKKAIKSALFKLMETKDINSITISELTERANVNRRTFYTHYRNITDILGEIESELVSALNNLSAGFDRENYEKSVYDLFLGLNRLITVDFDYYFHLVRVDTRGVLVSGLKNVIKTSAEEIVRHFSGKLDAESEAAAAFISGGFFNLYIEWYLNPRGLTEQQAAALASEMVSRCITAGITANSLTI